MTMSYFKNSLYTRVVGFVFFALVLAACSDSSDDASSTDLQTEKVEQAEMFQDQLNEIHEELRLTLKEVVSLSKKVDSLSSKTNLKQGDEDEVSKSVKLPDAQRLIGSSDAKIAMVEFMDFQCPYCVRYAKQVFPALKKRYIDTGKLRYGIRDFPLDFHTKAEAAAIAANCAGKQDKYWEFHDELISNSKSLGDELYRSLGEKYKLNIEKFTACRSDPKSSLGVQEDLSYGTEVGTRGTPNFFIGRIVGDSIVDVVQISGSRPIETFDRAIQQALTGR